MLPDRAGAVSEPVFPSDGVVMPGAPSARFGAQSGVEDTGVEAAAAEQATVEDADAAAAVHDVVVGAAGVLRPGAVVWLTGGRFKGQSAQLVGFAASRGKWTAIGLESGRLVKVDTAHCQLTDDEVAEQAAARQYTAVRAETADDVGLPDLFEA